jgi:Fe-S-cluster containining protein
MEHDVKKATFKVIDYGESHCKPCGAWCCHGEAPFVDSTESARLGRSRLTQQESGACEFLENGMCRVYALRPFECRIFPFDVLNIEGSLTWVLWEACPAHGLLDPEEYLEHLEHDLVASLPDGYLESYVAYHRTNQPEKYSAATFIKLRPVRVPSLLPKSDAA